MAGTSRRKVLIGASRFAAWSGLAWLASPASAAQALQLPPGPLRLVRRLERGLSDGASIVVTRDWQIEFARQGRGIAVSGRQLSAKVDAPEVLAPLAGVEQARSTDGMWPILLSEEGRIVSESKFTRAEDYAAALEAAETILAKQNSSAEFLAQRREYMARLQQVSRPLFDTMPSDLFYPAGEPFRTIREIDLPEGLSGQFEISYEAVSALEGSWLSRASRTIITRIGDQERRSSEDWSLDAI